MQLHNLKQGSDAWHQFRLQHFGASEAAAMLGISPTTTRTELLHAKKTGIAKEFSDFVQARVLDKGHEVEASARPIVEELIGDDLYPATVSSGKLSASCDGLTMSRKKAMEHKQWSKDLAAMAAEGIVPDYHMAQCQQILLVTKADEVIFTVSDGTRDNFLTVTVTPDDAWFERIERGWEQFEKDLAEFVPVEVVAAPVGKAPENLPALHIVLKGEVSASNLAEFKEVALAAIRSVNRDLQTDQDFADSAKARKWCEDIEAKVEGAKNHALSQTASIDELFRTMDEISAEARVVRLELEKLEKARNLSINGEVVADGVKQFADHIRVLNAAMPAPYMPNIPADFGGAIKGLRTVASKKNAVATELARVKIAADAMANRIHTNIAALRDAGVGMPPDLATLVIKAPDDFAAVIAQRKAAEQARLDAERERIRAEEAAKLQREADAKAAAEKAEANRLEQEEYQRQAEKNAMAMQEIQGIQQQVYIAVTGRGRRIGGTVECIRETLAETEAWKIEESNFGALTGTAQAAKDKAVADIKVMLTKAEEREQQAEISRQGADALGYAVAAPAVQEAMKQPVFIGVDLASGPSISLPEDDGARLTLTQLNAAIAPVSIDVAGLATLGFEPVEKVKASRLYRACDLPAICAAMARHLESVAEGVAA